MIRKPFYSMPAKGAPKLNAKERVLSQWRGRSLVSEEVSRVRSARSVADVLPKVLKNIRFEERQSDAEIIQVWNASLDPTLTKHAQPCNLHKGTLFVQVDSNVWLSEIVRYRRIEILKRLQNAFGPQKIQRLSFRVGG